jgi:hypothetical protein
VLDPYSIFIRARLAKKLLAEWLSSWSCIFLRIYSRIAHNAYGWDPPNNAYSPINMRYEIQFSLCSMRFMHYEHMHYDFMSNSTVDTSIFRVGLRCFNGSLRRSESVSWCVQSCLRTEGPSRPAFAIETYNLAVLVEYVCISILSPRDRSSCSAHYCSMSVY